MNQLENREVRMTSLEVVELINQFREAENLSGDKRRSSFMEHKSLMRKIRDEIEVLESLGFEGQQNFAPSSYVNSQNKEQPCYSLNRDGIIQMTVSESAVVRYKMVEYINQLESEIQQLRLPKNYKEALIALVEAEEVKEKQQLLIEEMKPKVEGYEDLLSVQSNHTMNDVAKVVGIGRNTLFKILRDNKVLMKDNLPYQDFIDRGYFSVREVVIKRVEYEDVKRQTLVTTKGVDYINKKLKEWM